MRRVLILTLVLACICSLGIAAVFAGGPGCSGAKMAKSEACTKTCTGGPEGFPAMVMMVGDKKFDCCMAAGKAAKEASKKVVYLIGEQKFECKDSAVAALADASEQYVERYLTVACVADGKVLYCGGKDTYCAGKGAMAKADGASCHGDKTMAAKSEGATCAKSGAKTAAVAKSDDKGTCTHAAMAKSEGSGCCKASGKAVAMTKEQMETCCKNAKEVKYLVCGRTFTKRDEAARAREDAMKALGNIKMTYIVDGKEVDCASKVCPVAKKEGKVVYMVNKEKLNCEFQARIALAKAQYEAAHNFAEKLAKI